MTYDELFAPVATFNGGWLQMIAVAGFIVFSVALLRLSAMSDKRVTRRVRVSRALFPIAIVGCCGLYVSQSLVDLGVGARNSIAVVERVEEHYNVEVVDDSIEKFDKKSDTFEVWDGEGLRSVSFVNLEDGLVLMDGPKPFEHPSK